MMRRLLLAALVSAVAASAAAAPAHRIISLSPGLTELAYDAGAGRYLVGAAATQYTSNPKEAAKLPSVGDAFHIDVERLVALKPDLVLAWASADPPELIARLRKLGLKVVVFKPRKLRDIAANLRRIGTLAGTRADADRAAHAFEHALSDLGKSYSKRQPVRVFFEISAKPLYTINGKQIISQAIRLCGGRNIFADLPSLAASVSVAAVIARNPRVIFATGDGESGAAAEQLKAWRRWPRLAAVKNDALFSLPPNEISRATPRILKGIEKVCRDLDNVRKHGSE
jgi:iron complex transport system substrate-binding protein